MISDTPLSATIAHSSLAESEIDRFYLAGEREAVDALLKLARIGPQQAAEVHATARELVAAVRTRRKQAGGLSAFLREYDLSSHEGVVLMCLAEALLRIPDRRTMDELIADKLTSADWQRHLGESDSLFVNASTWALMLTGKLIRPDSDVLHNPGEFLANVVARLEEPVVRSALKTAMAIMGQQFIMGATIEQALARASEKNGSALRYTYDMLGEAALTRQAADAYQDAYAHAIEAIAELSEPSLPLWQRPGISVKLSALCPRFDYTQQQRAVPELGKRLLTLACLAKKQGIGLTIDAEETDRLQMTLSVFKDVFTSPLLGDWPGMGLAVQAYQKRGLYVITWLDKLATAAGRMIPVRLVKGAYWDMEIKRAQEQGLKEYPVFTRKCNTDVSYLACARMLLDQYDRLYPQFATHNAHTVAYIYHTAGAKHYEFQRLHGMGEELYAEVMAREKFNLPCRVYAPVGAYDDLLPYLVRRLLENGANTSFINQALHEDTDIEEIIADPVAAVLNLGEKIHHPNIPLPAQLFTGKRLNSSGVNFADPHERTPLLEAMTGVLDNGWEARPHINGETFSGQRHEVRDPADRTSIIGHVDYADVAAIRKAIDVAAAAWPGWNDIPAGRRATMLERAADLYEKHRAELMALCVREAGKTFMDSHAEVREAVDFLRYYAAGCRDYFTEPLDLPGTAGESNHLYLQGRGLFLCISPWNFPVAIYTGQIAAALAAGNSVIAKPAEQTSLVAERATQLLYEAGIPPPVLNFLPGDGEIIGQTTLPDPRIAGVAFTGSTDTAQRINRLLARRNGPLATVIAETGGQNVMIADSSALPEQLVKDAVLSAFNSAGQRCSALRVLYLQEEIAPRVIGLLRGCMKELVIGDPMDLTTDIGPVIDADAKQRLEQHVDAISRHGKLLHRCKLPRGTAKGTFFAPVLIEIERLAQLHQEVFGPVLHIIIYAAADLPRIIDDINTSGYGLTLGIHSRIESRAEMIRRHARVGNVYVNRNMIGAVVGVQPFGGRGLSGTGPKAGGPYYLLRFASEQACTVNTAAVGGNAGLLNLTR
ncbi:MAG: bifunctional proline dehydrogenase/L-glutamate gamma-semialdehyde dehydrogenase PutA [Gammaproteobacteria bacterium]